MHNTPRRRNRCTSPAARTCTAPAHRDARYAKPLDEELLSKHLRQHRTLITLEEHQRAGGFGSAILEAQSRLGERACHVRTLGVPDAYQEHRTQREEQLAHCGLDAAGLERIVSTALRAVKRS